LQWQWCEEGSYGGYEEFELRSVRRAGVLVGDVVEDQVFDVFHDLGVAAVGVDCHYRYIGARGLMDCCGLGE
jgi:hypothetical protein